jgi:hypothetical protein
MFHPLEHWHEFYILVGTAAATLVALQFVAASLGAGYISFEKAEASRTYMTPVIVHFTAVLYACAVGLVPTHTALTLSCGIGIAAMVGLLHSGSLIVRVLKDSAVDLDDKLCYGVAPPISYAAGVAAAILFYFDSPHAAAVLAAALLGLLIVNIRNAWDLTLFMARKHTEAKRPPAP